jgi:DNA-binding transcriptional LysR family regulator
MDFLDQMGTFVDIVDAGSLSAAARRRRLSLAAVSRQLGALEHELGAPLIVRTTRTMTVTDAGRQFYQHALQALRDVDAARAVVRDTHRAGGTLRVSAGVTIGLEQLVHALPALAEAHPALAIELRLEDHASDLVRDGVDIALRAGLAPPDSTSMLAKELARFHRWVVAAPRYLRAHGTPKSVASLAKHRALIQLSDLGELSTWPLGDETIRVRGTLRCTAPSALRQLALAGSGIALLPDWLVRDDITAHRLVRVLPELASPPVSLWALHRIELRDAPRVRVFLDHLARVFGTVRRA